jgi:hypothetical protein
VKPSARQRDLLARMARGRPLFVRLERSEGQLRETCWIGDAKLHPMIVNALIMAGLIEPHDEIRGRHGARTIAYGVSDAGRGADRGLR